MPRLFVLALTVTAVACATAVPPNQTSVWGHVQLVPHEDLRDAKAAGNAYGDRRIRSAKLVDYSRPGFAVVYLDTPGLDTPGLDTQGTDTPAVEVESDLQLVIRGGDIRARFEPAHLAMRIGSVIRLRNLDRGAHFVSCPEAAVLQQVGPGQEVRLELSKPGDYRFYLADVPGAVSIVFVAPGPFAVTSDSGRYQISELTPGSRTLYAWHPRFPPASREVVLVDGDSLEVDIQIGVGQIQEAN